MSQTPPSNPPGSPQRKPAPGAQIHEDFAADLEDPTSISQIPRETPMAQMPSPMSTPMSSPVPPQPPSRPSGTMHPLPGAQVGVGHFAAPSPSLSHIGGAPPPPYGGNHGPHGPGTSSGVPLGAGSSGSQPSQMSAMSAMSAMS